MYNNSTFVDKYVNYPKTLLIILDKSLLLSDGLKLC